MIRRAAILALAAALAACSEPNEDLKQWMAEESRNMTAKLPPVPQVRPYEPFAYNAFDLPDPFKPRKIEPTRTGGTLAPDPNRRKEPLEAYPLEALALVGTLQQGKTLFALVRTNDRTIHRVTVGNYLGQNYGVITGIAEDEVRIKELIQDSAGDWSERAGRLQLVEPEQKSKEQTKR